MKETEKLFTHWYGLLITFRMNHLLRRVNKNVCLSYRFCMLLNLGQKKQWMNLCQDRSHDRQWKRKEDSSECRVQRQTSALSTIPASLSQEKGAGNREQGTEGGFESITKIQVKDKSSGEKERERSTSTRKALRHKRSHRMESKEDYILVTMHFCLYFPVSSRSPVEVRLNLLLESLLCQLLFSFFPSVFLFQVSCSSVSF